MVGIAFKNERKFRIAASWYWRQALLSFCAFDDFLCISFSCVCVCVWESNLTRWGGEYQLMLYKQLFFQAAWKPAFRVELLRVCSAAFA